MAASSGLFELDPPLSFHYSEDFITHGDERVLLEAMAVVIVLDFETRMPSRRSATPELALARRSSYLTTQQSRTAYEHHIPPVAALRYSVTFRTLR